MRGQRTEGAGNGRRRLARSRRGVAAILGALFALLIFLVAFGLVLTQTLPVWMEQNETSFVQSAQGSIAALQSTIGLQAATGAPATALTPVSLSSASVPVLASPTVGSVAFEPPSPAGYVNVSWSGGSGDGAAYTNATLGRLVVTLPNRYISSEVLDFEDGALLSVVGTNAPMIAYGPAFTVLDRPGNLSVSLVVVSMAGANAVVNGPGTREIADALLAHTTRDVAGSGSPTNLSLTIRVGSSLACAWGAFYVGALAAAGVPIVDYSISGPTNCASSSPGGTTFTLTLGTLRWVSLELLDLGISLEGA